MVNNSLFASMLGRLPKSNAVNDAGGRAHKLEPKHALAQVAATGTFGNAFYSTIILLKNDLFPGNQSPSPGDWSFVRSPGSRYASID